MFTALRNWIAVRSPVVKAQEAELLQRDRKIDILERELFLEKQRRCDLQADVAWLQAEIQKTNIPLGTIRKAIATTATDWIAGQEVLHAEFRFDTALGKVLPIPLLVEKIAGEMMVASMKALANHFQIPWNIRLQMPAFEKEGDGQ
jgi:hypothetical protein